MCLGATRPEQVGDARPPVEDPLVKDANAKTPTNASLPSGRLHQQDTSLLKSPFPHRKLTAETFPVTRRRDSATYEMHGTSISLTVS
jgi:hypothetical protein